MRIYIIGYMGAGKSTVGKRLANRLGMDFVDLDDAFENRFRYSIPHFFDHFGEAKFRELEQQCLNEITTEHEHAVVSTGGGTACFHGNIDFMNTHGITVYLRMHPKSLATRLNNARRLRPVIRDIPNDDMTGFVEKQLAEREPYYQQAHITVKGEDVDLEGLAHEVEFYKNNIET